MFEFRPPAASMRAMTDDAFALPHRLRRNRQHDWLRRAVAETALAPADLVWPVFVHDHEASLPVASMPGVERLPIDGVVTDAWRDAVVELDPEDEPRINRLKRAR